MRALDSLDRDHRLLQSLTEALEAYAAALEVGHPLHPGDLSDIVQGFRTIADYRHFEKVEEVLIPWLVRRGFDDGKGLDALSDFEGSGLDDGREERERMRYLIEVLHQSAERELDWNLDERRRIISAARHLVEEQRRMTAREAVELFPEIVTRLGPAALAELAGQLCQFDQASAGRWPEYDIGALTQSVLARYSAASQPQSSSPRDLQASP